MPSHTNNGIYWLKASWLFVLAFSLSSKAPADGLSQEERTTSDAALTGPMQLVSDLNGDGKLDDKDVELAEKAKGPGLNDDSDDRIKGTEYLFPTDNLSHGIWSVNDLDPITHQPRGTIDDNAKALKITCKAPGLIWFDYPNDSAGSSFTVSNLGFYLDSACKNKLPLPYTLTSNGTTIYVRAETIPLAEVHGSLILQTGPDKAHPSSARASMLLDIVKGFGDHHFFPAADRYIRQNNCLHYYACKYYMPVPGTFTKSEKIHLVVRREENTTMQALDAYRTTPTPLVSIFQVAGQDNAAYPTSGYPNADEIINGVLCGSTKTVATSASGTVNGPWSMYSQCLGYIISNYNLSPASLTNVPGMFLSGPEGRYIAMIPPHSFTYGMGIVPTKNGTSVYKEAMGGFGSLSPKSRTYASDYATNLLGVAKVDSTHRALFTVTYDDAHAGHVTPAIVADAASSKCIPLEGPGSAPDEISLFWGDGDISIAMALTDPIAPTSTTPPRLHVMVASARHDDRYRTDRLNPYLIFNSTKPDPHRNQYQPNDH
jgi:hypothetical protein